MKFKLITLGAVTTFGLALAMGACSAVDGNSFEDDDGNTGSGSGAGSGSGGEATGGGFNPQTGTGGNNGDICQSGDDEDKDADGFTKNQGDCNDCDPNVNPGAIEVQTDISDPEASPADENCDGTTDEPRAVCDTGLDIANVDAMSAAAALDLCQQSTNGSWGIISANYVRANGGAAANPGLAVGILDGFGTNVPPRGGDRMLAISSGHSRDEGDPSPCNSQTCMTTGPGNAPPGFPQDNPSCPPSQSINDDIALEIDFLAPTNATGYSFDFRFYSFEYPEWVCDTYNDQFIALVDPAPMGALNGNISFDSMNNPVSVNIAFFDVCDGCPLGTTAMAGTGFNAWNDAGATDWLVTQAPVQAGATTKIRFIIFDVGDAAFDSTAIIDNFQIIADAGTVTVGTQPVPK